MADPLIALGRRIANMKPLVEGPVVEWHHGHDERGGLPTCIPPFYIEDDRDDERNKLGTFSVRVIVKGGGDPAVFAGVPDFYDAFHKMADAVRAWFPHRPIERVYFIGKELRRGELIKVGFSRDPQARLKALQTASGDRLHIFATVEGGADLEAKYHRRWSARRRSGEWFTIGDCILAEIARLKSSPSHTEGAA
ncbi:GIY-YIG nuclease family protein [Novosphingobium sp.]|uniref:GIY-YIG nuclease family protein n=1 Tax=Novosphingobium sp. TaxID=1874826 RepID=UPI00286D9ECA|nr:GIY-YIG nuclease family protein [Novosphingobium sp.]